MEAAYDKNNSNNAFDNDSSHFKFSNTDGGFNISPDMPVSNDSEKCQMISPPALVKNCYNESNDAHITDESVDVVDNHQRFEDDFGPETDVDAMDETTFIKSPVEPQANDNNNEFSLSNGVKPFSLENKIMQQLSEQNRDFLTDSNPFKNDHYDQYSDDHALLDQTAKASDDSSAEVVDNKIIDALESLAVSNGENEKHELEDGKQEGDLLDIRQQSPDIPDLTEKADYVHEKNLFMFDSAAKPDDTFMQHSDSTFNQAEEQKSSLLEQDTPSLADTRCVDESVGEDSEEEEDEWNYIKGDKKAEEKHNPSAAELVADPAQSSENQSSESIVEVANATVSNEAPEQQLLDFTSEDTVQKEEEPLSENEKIDETKDDIVETEESIAKTEDTVREGLEEQPEDSAVSIEQELADYENNCSTVVSSDVALSSENSNTVPFDEKLNLDTAQNLLLEEASPSELVESSSEIDAEQEQPSTEAVAEDEPVTDIVTEEAQSTEIVAEPTSSMNIVEEDTPSTEIVVEEAPVEKQTTEDQSSDIVTETSVDEELERPDSLSFEMASKLNPEAKEFVPVSSPTRSNPTSPVANAPSMVPNSFLMLDDDTVVAQSPKKFTSTMDNIDVPAEDDFQHEMNNRPHELEKPSEYVNGNADVSVRSHSPVSEPSYQELNLKEAMQADEKLEHDYNDEKQVVTEDSPSDIPNEENILNVLNKEQDPMNMSFYEGRDEALLSNSDELNKVHMLPEVEDEIEEPSNDDTDKVQADMHELTPTEPVELLEDKMEITEPESTSQPTCEEELQPKSPLPEEPSAAIFAVASQVVNDVAALVDQMQIESPVVDDADLEQSEEQHSEVPVEKPAENTTDDTKLDETRDILVSLELQNENKPLEEALDIDQQPESPSPNPVESLHGAETEELVSPLVESLQQEVVAENEFITDESVLNVQSPSKSMFSAEAPTESEPVLEEPIKEPIATETTESLVVEPVAELVEESTTPNLLETVTPVLEQVAAIPDAQPVVEELKSVVAETKTATTKPTTKTSTTAKPTTSKTTTAKTTKPAAPTVEKKTTTAAKLSAKPATTKPSTTTKPATTSTIKKATTVSSAPSTRTTSAAKPPSSSTVGRSSTVGSATTKPATEKKAPLTIKKPATTAVNGEVKAAPAARKPTSTLKSTTARSSATSSGSATSARPSSASVRSTTAKPSTATTKSTTSAPAKSSTTATTRTSSTVPTAKPRTVPSTGSKTASSTTTTTSTTMVPSKPSSNAITKRFSTVGAPAPKTTTATATTKTTTAVKTTHSVASRTSTVSKVSSTTVTGVRKTTTTSPIKKPASSPAAKTTPSSVKAPVSLKNAGLNHSNGKDSIEVAPSTDLLDLDKEFKNDNNQLITKNGIDSQMMVIDSAAD